MGKKQIYNEVGQGVMKITEMGWNDCLEI